MSVAKDVLRSVIIPGAEGLVGRANVVRFARFVTNAARRDAPNDMRDNGERTLMRAICEHAPPSMTVLDIGANVGDWTASFLAAARDARRDDFVLHAFEPCAATHAALRRRIDSLPYNGRVMVHPNGISDEQKEATLHVVGDGAGVNSVHVSEGYQWTRTERIKLDTVDAFAERCGLAHVTFAKSDTEGHDLHVLLGARRLLSRCALSVIQFEYNWRWVMARNFLRDVFELAGSAYRVGKVTHDGVEWYASWDPELETYREGNYVLCLNECVGWFRPIRWWKLDV